MSTHPNAMLLAELSPDDLPRKTLKALAALLIVEGEDEDDLDELQVEIPNGKTSELAFQNRDSYHVKLMTDDYDESNQIKAATGSIVLYDLVTYGYGERILWDELVAQKERLEAWCKINCDKLRCTYKIYITANYW